MEKSLLITLNLCENKQREFLLSLTYRDYQCTDDVSSSCMNLLETGGKLQQEYWQEEATLQHLFKLRYAHKKVGLCCKTESTSLIYGNMTINSHVVNNLLPTNMKIKKDGKGKYPPQHYI